MSNVFESTSVKLSQSPLGIIALFIVLIHGFASLVLGLSAADIGETNRSVLVMFLVLFPVVVFFVFAWLVSRHHANLYPPQAFHQEEHFVSLAFGRANFDKRGSSARPPKKSPGTTDSVKTSATGSIFWLGHDLMWTADVLLRRGERQDVLIGFDQALHHTAQVGLGETPIEREIRSVRDRIQQSDELSPAARDEYAQRLGFIIDSIGMTVESAQRDFAIPPHWARMRPRP